MNSRCITEQYGPIRILRLAQVLNITGLGKTKIYQLQSEGNFPMRVQITDHSVGWIEQEVQAWLAKRVAISMSLTQRSHSGLNRNQTVRLWQERALRWRPLRGRLQLAGSAGPRVKSILGDLQHEYAWAPTCV